MVQGQPTSVNLSRWMEMNLITKRHIYMCVLVCLIGLSGCQLIFSPPDRFPELNERPITGPGNYDLPQWSPDGRYLAYIDDEDYQGYLTVFDVATQNHRRIASGAFSFHSWKPDGSLSYLSLALGSHGPIYDLHQVDVEGTTNETIFQALPEVGNYSWVSNDLLLILLGRENDNTFERSLYALNTNAGTKELLLSSQEINFEYLAHLSLSPDKRLLVMHGVRQGDELKGAIIIYDLENRMVLDQIIAREIFPAIKIDYPPPSWGDNLNFGWIADTNWVLLTLNTPEGDCYNYSLVFLDTNNLVNSFCIPSTRGPFTDPTISPDLSTLAFITIVGPTESYLMLADVPSEFLNNLNR